MAKDLINQCDWLASVDLKDAYYSAAIRCQDRKYVRFVWQDQLYEFTCLPNGLPCCPQIFTCLLKPIFSAMSKKLHFMFPYIDDPFIVADTQEPCAKAVHDLCELFTQTGFKIHIEKSVLWPTH